MKKLSKPSRILAIVISVMMMMVLMPTTALADGEFTATLMGQLDIEVNADVDEWGIGDIPEASVTFNLGEEATISMEFDAPIKFTGNWTGIATDIPVDSDEAAEEIGGGIVSFVVDGNELGSRWVPLIDRDEEGYLTIDIARQWGGDYDAYDLQGMEPFSTIEITFILGAQVAFDEGFERPEVEEDEAEPEGLNLDETFYAFIGGVFLTDEGEFDWIPFTEQNVGITINEPFTVVLDFGDETQTHGEAEWGFITVVETDMPNDWVPFLDAFIEEILVDGRSISFTGANIEVGAGDDGVRISLTNGWTDTPVVAGAHVIGEFSRLEVTMVFTEIGHENPFGDDEPAPPPPPPAEPPPPVVVDPIAPQEEPPAPEGFPIWGIVLIIVGGVVIVVIVIVIILKNKKKKKD